MNKRHYCPGPARLEVSSHPGYFLLCNRTNLFHQEQVLNDTFHGILIDEMTFQSFDT